MGEDILLFGQIYFENEMELSMYERCIDILKKFGYKILIADSSPSNGLLFNYRDLCDYYLYDKENKLFDRKNSIRGKIDYFYVCSDYEIVIPCDVTQNHELNIVYQTTKVLDLAKTMGYKYVLRLECDSVYEDDDIQNLKNKIDECISTNKKAIFIMDEGDKSIRFTLSFLDIDWYIEKMGRIVSEEDWDNFLKLNNLQDDSLEKTLYTVFSNYRDNIIDYQQQKNKYLKTFRYKETRRFFKSNAIIDFFKDDRGVLFFCVTNNDNDIFPQKLMLTQSLENGEFRYNTMPNPSYRLFWVVIEDVKYVELNVDDKTFRLDKNELTSTINRIKFFN